MKSKAGIWLDSNCTLVVHARQEGLHSENIKPGKFSNILSFVNKLTQFIKSPFVSKNNHSQKFRAPNRSYFKNIMRATGQVDELYVFGDQEIENDFYREIKSFRQWSPKKIEVYPVFNLSPNLRFRQIKAFLT